MSTNDFITLDDSLQSVKIMKKWQDMIDLIDTYLKSVGKELKVINVEDGDVKHWENVITVITKLGKVHNIENIITCVSSSGGELIRWIYYDVQFRIDNRLSGKMGITGD